MITLNGCGYKDYYKIPIPTNSLLRGTIKIPNEWRFVIDDEIIKLIDRDSREVIAEQIVQDHFELISNVDGNKIFNEEKLSFNNNIKYDIKNPKNYSFDKGYSNAVYKYKYTENSFVFDVLDIQIYRDKDLCIYYLMLIIYADIEDKKLEKIINSYCFGGVVGYEKDHIYI